MEMTVYLILFWASLIYLFRWLSNCDKKKWGLKNTEEYTQKHSLNKGYFVPEQQ
jgi:hypothetical protein